MLDIFSTDIVRYFHQGGMFMYPILAVSVFGTLIFVERVVAYRTRFRVDARRLLNDVKKYIHANDLHRAIETCRQFSLAPVAQVLAAGLTNAQRPMDEIDTAMEAEALYYLPKINARISYLAVLSNLSTLLGLLGTISGLIASFAAIGGNNLQVGREEALAGGIAVAMTTTAFGLVVAIPMLLMHQYVANQAGYLVDEIQHSAAALKKLLQRMKDQSGDKLTLQSILDEERDEKTPTKASAGMSRG